MSVNREENDWTDEVYLTLIQEDLILLKLIRVFGLKKWKTIAFNLNQIFKDANKKAKVCKERL